MLTRLEKNQKSCGNSVLGDIQNLTGQGPEQPALMVLPRAADWNRDLQQTLPTLIIL